MKFFTVILSISLFSISNLHTRHENLIQNEVVIDLWSAVHSLSSYYCKFQIVSCLSLALHEKAKANFLIEGTLHLSSTYINSSIFCFQPLHKSRQSDKCINFTSIQKRFVVYSKRTIRKYHHQLHTQVMNNLLIITYYLNKHILFFGRLLSTGFCRDVDSSLYFNHSYGK